MRRSSIHSAAAKWSVQHIIVISLDNALLLEALFEVGRPENVIKILKAFFCNST